MSQSTFVKSTFILTIATLLSKILGSIFRIPLQNIAGDEVLGIFSLVYPVYMVALILSVAGLPLAISKLIAEANTKKDNSSVREVFTTASLLAIMFGFLSFTLIFSFSNEIANMLGGPTTRLALIVVAGTLLVAPYMAVYRGFFQGFADMKPTAISQVLEQLIRVSLILLIAYFLVSKGYSDEVIAGGVMVGSIVGALASLIYLRIKYDKSPLKLVSSNNYSFVIFKKWTKTILSVSIPIAIGTLTMALFNFVDSFTVSYGLRAAGSSTNEINYLYGIYGRGLSLVQIATVFATSIVLPLVPLITTKLANKDTNGTRSIIERTHRMTHFISWPAAMGLLALTLPLNLALFTNLEGSSMLAIINFSSVFTSFALLGTGILQGMNYARTSALVIIGSVILKTFSNIYFIQWFGLDGAAISTLCIYIILVFTNSIIIMRRIKFKLFNTEVFKIIVSASIMGGLVGIPTLFFSLTDWSRMQAVIYLGFSILLGALIYFALLFLLKVITKDDIKNSPLLARINIKK
ncbi:putative polysaccharide biosynthesis protein [Paraliobacillus salinarum]|uniref:putative polysaccharide biosynthesis protein n=1 Tax=Paraliobacillus salinarum TaxID=1158996 RepID=UPI0015F5B0CF|nr:polysaccharide biosynthesis protein [Paraliobacillus salinarum]